MCSRHPEPGAGYDITSATADGAQESTPIIDYARICGLPHELTDDDGMGMVLYSRDEDGIGTKVCPNCEYIRDDFRGWLLVHGYKVPVAA